MKILFCKGIITAGNKKVLASGSKINLKRLSATIKK